ncbi:MAG: glycosyltransferase family 9 protein [Acetobacteraceae bacterium]|nr:glycosyltransferase family 9 protein [Acetobacteraceae bacterium]
MAPQATVAIWKGLRTKAAALPHAPRIVVLKLDHLGDFITGLAAMAQLRASFPDSRITLVCGSWNRTWAETSGLFDVVLPFDFFAAVSGANDGGLQGIAKFKELPIGPCDLAVDLRHDFDTRPLLQAVDAAFRAGFCAPVEMGGGALDIALPDLEHISIEAGTGRPVHAEMRLELLVAAIVSAWSQRSHPARRLVAGTATRGPDRAYAVLAPGAGSPIRVWPADRLIEVGRTLTERYDFDIVLTGSPAEREACAAIAAALPAERTWNLAGELTLAGLPALIDRASLYVGYDTGTTHLAAALGVPTVAVMGGIPDPDVWHAEGLRVSVVTARIACSGCYLKHPGDCPFGVRCLLAISADHVLAAAEGLLVQEAPSEVA